MPNKITFYKNTESSIYHIVDMIKSISNDNDEYNHKLLIYISSFDGDENEEEIKDYIKSIS